MRGLAVVAVLAACSQHSADVHEQAPVVKPPAPDRRAIELPGDANGALWDGATLFVTDNTHGQIVRWTDAGGFTPFGAAVPGKTAFGGLVRIGDDIVTTSFGFGKDGTVLVVGANPRAVAKLDPARRRIGIARAPDGILYDVYFIAGNGKHAGGLAKLDLDTGETDLAADLAKPVGVAATADTIYVSDQDDNTIVAFERTTLARRVVAHVPGVDLLTLLPDGDLVTGGKTGAVYRVRPSTGAVTTIASDFTQVRGTAYDAAGKRLFVVEHSVATAAHHVHVVPLDAGGP